MQEQRLTRRITGYWDLVRRGGEMPEISHFNKASLEDVWPFCFQVSVNNQGQQTTYHYDYMGKPIIEMYGRDLTGTTVDQHTAQFPGKVLHHKFNTIITDRKPLKDDGHFMSEKGKMVKYRACMLPFGNEKKGVTHIVVGLTYRNF